MSFSRSDTRSTDQLEVSDGENFRRGCAVAGAADSAWCVKESQRVAQVSVEFPDALRRLVGKNHRAVMRGEPLGRSFLVLPAESALGVGSELDVVGWVCVDEVVGCSGTCSKLLWVNSQFAKTAVNSRKSLR